MRENYRQQMNQHGLPDGNSLYERQPVFMHDTLLWKATSGSVHSNIINSQELFDDTVKHPLLKTNKFPLPYTRIVRLTHVAVTHNIDFLRDDHLFAFEEFSYLDVNVEGSDQFKLPMEYILNYSRLPQGKREVLSSIKDIVQSDATDPLTPADHEIFFNTAEQALKYYDGTAWIGITIADALREKLVPMPKYTGYVQLPAPLDLPRGGMQKITFQPGGSGMTTTSITDNGYKFGANIIDSADSPVMYCKFKFAGRLVKPLK